MGRGSEGHDSEEEQQGDQSEAADGRLQWFEKRVANAMRLKPGKLKALAAGQSRCAGAGLTAACAGSHVADLRRELLFDFLDMPSVRRIIVCNGTKGIEAVAKPPPVVKKNTKAVFFLKLTDEKITMDNINQMVRFGAAVDSCGPLVTVADLLFHMGRSSRGISCRVRWSI